MLINIITVIVAIMGLGVLILVHEGGHFISAKIFGMKAEKFYLGFPPAALKKQVGETEYGIGYVPLGGYVKIVGMSREEEVAEEDVPRAYYSKPVWQRVITISAGPLMNVFIAALLFFIFYWVAVPVYQNNNSIHDILQNSGAQSAGLQPDDRVLAVNGAGSSDPEVIRQALRDHPDQNVTLTIDRGGQQTNVVAFVGHSDSGEGQLGITFGWDLTGYQSMPIGEALKNAGSDIVTITTAVFAFLKDLFVSSQARQDISSPIGIVAVSSQVIQMSWSIYLRLLAFISLQLAIINLLPLLPLDGGHVLFNLLEKIKGSPIKREVFERVSVVGIALFVILIFLGGMNDIQRLFGQGFNVGP